MHIPSNNTLINTNQQHSLEEESTAYQAAENERMEERNSELYNQ